MTRNQIKTNTYNKLFNMHLSIKSSIRSVKEDLKGRKVKLLNGKYRGRHAIIKIVCFEVNDANINIFLFVDIPKINGEEGNIWGDHIDARRGYELSEIEFIGEEINE